MVSCLSISLFNLNLFVCLFSQFFFFNFKKAIFTHVSFADMVLVAPIWNHPQETFFFSFWIFQKGKILNISMNNTCAHCSIMLVQSVLDTVINKSLKAFFCVLNKGYRKPWAGSSLVNITSCFPTCTRSSFTTAAVWVCVGTSLSALEPRGSHGKWIGHCSNGGL